MRVVFDHQIFAWQEYGGISRYFCELANRIADMETHDVEIFAPLYVNEYLHNRGKARVRGLKLPKPLYSLRFKGAVNLFASRLVTGWRNDVDIFHETYFSKTDHGPRSGKRIVTIHDMIHELYPADFPRNDQTREFKARAVARADHVICVSENTRADLMRLLNVPREKTSVVYHGHTLTAMETARTEERTDKPYILYVGQRHKYKNFARLVRAFARSDLLRNHFSLVCFGGGAFNLVEADLISSLRLAPGAVTHASGGDIVLANLYSCASAFVYPSLYEGFGIPPLEAMSFGCPVVCSNMSSIPEVVGEAAEMFDPVDECNMRSAIERVVADPERSASLVALGKERAKFFSWQECARKTVDVYRQVLQR